MAATTVNFQTASTEVDSDGDKSDNAAVAETHGTGGGEESVEPSRRSRSPLKRKKRSKETKVEHRLRGLTRSVSRAPCRSLTMAPRRSPSQRGRSRSPSRGDDRESSEGRRSRGSSEGRSRSRGSNSVEKSKTPIIMHIGLQDDLVRRGAINTASASTPHMQMRGIHLHIH
jgi:hypothetical protein